MVDLYQDIVAEERARLDFAKLAKHCPELADRVKLMRARVKDLRQKFAEDAEWALGRFKRMTWITLGIGVAGAGVAVGLAICHQDSALAGALGLSFTALLGLAGAGARAFGWHKRYQALFAARWAMASLETRIDDFILNLALNQEAGNPLDQVARQQLASAKALWLDQIDASMRAFGEIYGGALKPVDVKGSR